MHDLYWEASGGGAWFNTFRLVRGLYGPHFTHTPITADNDRYVGQTHGLYYTAGAWPL